MAHQSETAIDPRFTHRARQPGLDLLRALAIIVVVIYHAALFGFKLPGRVDRFGWIGVDLFFVLSGYLIGGQLLAPLARGQRINLGRFFARRALRIMPAYFVVLAIYIFLSSWREYPEMYPTWKFLLSDMEISPLRAKYRAPWRHRLLARVVARGRRSILSLSSVHLALCKSLAPRGDHHSECNCSRRNLAPHISRLSKS